MKRVILIVAFFAGLVPNVIEMNMESVYCAMGQSLYDENENGGFPHCDICSGELTEVGYGMDKVSYCSNCQFYCETCKGVFSMTNSEDIAIHDSSCSDNENDNEKEDGDSDNEKEDGKEELIIIKFICLECQTYIFTETAKEEHTKQYGHYLFKEVGQ